MCGAFELPHRLQRLRVGCSSPLVSRGEKSKLGADGRERGSFGGSDVVLLRRASMSSIGASSARDGLGVGSTSAGTRGGAETSYAGKIAGVGGAMRGPKRAPQSWQKTKFGALSRPQVPQITPGMGL